MPRFGPGRGYALTLSAPTSYYSANTAYPFVKVNHKAVCHLYPGWNLIGTPNYQSITWNTSAIRVRRPNPSNNSQVVPGSDGTVSAPYDEPLSQAASEDVIDDHAWTYDDQHLIEQNPGPGDYNQIQPLNAYWIYVHVHAQENQELELLLPSS
ncbi:MAG TPA: hypothetical protein VFJ58_18620 [Armatimonadota bacterium]|nr:hypothetical protein [Armatimonadota bacterium]